MIFFTNFSDQVLVNKTIKINNVGKDYFDCLTDDEQNYVQQMPKYAHLNYDQVHMLLNSLDDYDKNTLMAEVNTMTSQKMSVANKISQERVAEMDKLHKETMAKYGR